MIIIYQKLIVVLAKVLVIGLFLAAQSIPAQTSPTNQQQLNQLFDQLKSAPNQQIAITYENQIWQLWFQSGNREIDDLMQQAMQRRRVYDFNGSIELLNQIIELNPDYSEGWNQRATMRFYQEKYAEALEDIAKTLELEPRHFGALAGRAIIRLKQFKPVIARKNIDEALKLHPYLKERSYFPDLL